MKTKNEATGCREDRKHLTSNVADNIKTLLSHILTVILVLKPVMSKGLKGDFPHVSCFFHERMAHGFFKKKESHI